MVDSAQWGLQVVRCNISKSIQIFITLAQLGCTLGDTQFQRFIELPQLGLGLPCFLIEAYIIDRQGGPVRDFLGKV